MATDKEIEAALDGQWDGYDSFVLAGLLLDCQAENVKLKKENTQFKKICGTLGTSETHRTLFRELIYAKKV